MKAPVFDQTGKEIRQILLPKEIFGLELNSDLVHQVVVSQTANRRKVTAHTKDRSEVRGGGRKPWMQKGTGRARHGSTRSPLWIGGGVTFGPTNKRVFKKKINQKARRKALLQVLSAKAKNSSVLVLQELKLEEAKTKLMSSLTKKLPLKGKSALIVLPSPDKNLILAARNLPKVKTCQAKDLNVLDLLSSQYLIIPQESIKVIKETFLR